MQSSTTLSQRRCRTQSWQLGFRRASLSHALTTGGGVRCLLHCCTQLVSLITVEPACDTLLETSTTSVIAILSHVCFWKAASFICKTVRSQGIVLHALKRHGTQPMCAKLLQACVACSQQESYAIVDHVGSFA